MGDRFEFDIQVQKPLVKRSHGVIIDPKFEGKQNNNIIQGVTDDEMQQPSYDPMVMSLDSKGNPKLILYSYRWAILLIFGMTNAAVGMAMMTCGPVSALLSKAYGVETLLVNLCALSFLIMFVPGNFATIHIVGKYGFKRCLIIGSIFVIIGVWIRMISVWTDFYAVLGGQIVAAIGQPFIQNPVGKMATSWFGDKERGIATAVGSMSMPLGCLISLLLPNAFFGDGMTSEQVISKEAPPSPPSVLFNEQPEEITLTQGLKELFSNKNYVKLFFCFNFLYGLYSAIAGVLTSFTEPYDYSTQQNSIVALVFMISGIFNSFFIGTILDKYQCYKKCLVIICLSAVVSLALSGVGLPYGGFFGEVVIMMFTGASVIPIVSISFSLAAEITYPVPEVYSIGIMISVAQVFGFILVRTYLFKHLFLGNSHVNYQINLYIIICSVSPLYGVIAWVICALISATLSFFVQGINESQFILIYVAEDLRRLQIDDVKNSEYIEEDEIRRFSVEQRSLLFNQSNVIADDDVKFEFQADGGTGGFNLKTNKLVQKLNKSQDYANDMTQ